MHVRTPLRLAGLTAAGALAAASLAVATAPAAHAAPVFSDADTYVWTDNFSHDDGSCTDAEVNTTDTNVPLVENGAAASNSASASSTHDGAATDDATGAVQASGSATIKSAGGVPTTLDFTASGSGTATFVQNPSTCWVHSGATVGAQGKFTLTQAGIMHLTTSGTGGFYGYVSVYSDTTDDTYVDVEGNGKRFSGDVEVYLPAGTYWLEARGSAQLDTQVAKSVSGTVKAHAEFHVAGTQTAAQTGKGKKYVSFPATRNCAAGTLAPTVTDKKKRAQKIKVVKVFVNDALVKKFKKPKKGAALSVPVAADQAADVTVEVTTLPKKLKNGKKKPGKVYETSASYEACS